MKKIFIILIIFLIGCTQYNDLPIDSVQLVYSPTWFSDKSHSKIAFLYKTFNPKNSTYKLFLYSASLDGSSKQILKELSLPNFSTLECSPNGEKFLISSNLTNEIFVMDRNGENFIKIDDGESPTWGPLNNQIVYLTSDKTIVRLTDISIPPYSNYRKDIPVTLTQDSYIEKSLSDPSQNIKAFYPTWTSDGMRIQWLSLIPDKSKDIIKQTLYLYIYDIQLKSYSRIKLLTMDPILTGKGSWSPDKTKLVFSHINRLYLLKMDGSPPVELTSGREYIEGVNCQWSPDGNSIIYDRFINKNQSDILLYDINSNIEYKIIDYSDIIS